MIKELKLNHDVLIVATKKDILLDLLNNVAWEYLNILPGGRKDNKLSIAISLLKQDYRLYKICKKFKPNLLVGTSTEITHIGKILKIKSLFFIEDDLKIVPLVGLLAHPFADFIISPSVCDNGKWNKKTIKYPGYQKLAYLHPDLFVPNKSLLHSNFQNTKYYILRLSKLGAHHDGGIKGISKDLLLRLINLLEMKGNVFISSEGKLPSELLKYELKINIDHIHHYLAFCDLFISDSQSMSLEAALLGIPNLRISSFSGKINVLEELEHIYGLTKGLKPENEIEIINFIEYITSDPDIKSQFKEKQKKLLKEKINVSEFITWLIENFPDSIKHSNNQEFLLEKFKNQKHAL